MSNVVDNEVNFSGAQRSKVRGEAGLDCMPMTKWEKIKAKLYGFWGLGSLVKIHHGAGHLWAWLTLWRSLQLDAGL